MEIVWSRCKSSCFPYDFDEGLVSCIEASDPTGRNHQNDGVMLADRKLSELSVLLLEGEQMSLLELRSQMRGFLTAWYRANVEESPVMAPEGVASIRELARDL